MLAARTPVDWAEILAFIEQRAPGTTGQIVGASPPQLEALQRRAPVPLPKNYIGFLRHMGSADGGFPVFPEHYYLVQALLGCPEASVAWDTQHFFLVGFQDPRTVREDPHELFLNLAQSDGIDAPLVGFQPGPSPTQMSIEHGIADWTIFRVAWHYGMDNKPAHARLISWCDAEPGGEAALRRQSDLVSMMVKLGFKRCLPATPHSWFGIGDQETFALLQIDPDDDMISLDLRGDDRSFGLHVSEVIEDQGLAKPGRIID